MTMELLNRFWFSLLKTHSADLRVFSHDWVTIFYEIGVVDQDRISREAWEQFFRKFPQNELGFEIKFAQLPLLEPFFSKKIPKRPFDPQKLKQGIRPQKWLQDLYEKILRFETILSPAEWEDFVSSCLSRFSKKDDKFAYDDEFVKKLQELLLVKPSLLRQFELFYHQGIISAASTITVASTKTPPLRRDVFVTVTEEVQKKAQMEKLYYHHEHRPVGNDQDYLDFLKDIAAEEDEN